jgi:hypothetical protein
MLTYNFVSEQIRGQPLNFISFICSHKMNLLAFWKNKELPAAFSFCFSTITYLSLDPKHLQTCRVAKLYDTKLRMTTGKNALSTVD